MGKIFTTKYFILSLIYFIIVIISLYFYCINFILKKANLNPRELQENNKYSEIIVIAEENEPYINLYFNPQTEVEFETGNKIIMKWSQKINNCYNMFYNTSIIQINLSNFDTSEVTTMEKMFYNCIKLIEFNLKYNNLSNLNSMNGIFDNCITLSNISFENIEFIELTSINNIFTELPNLSNIYLSDLNFTRLTSMESAFSNINTNVILNISLNNIDISNVETMNEMFKKCNNLANINFINIKAYKVKKKKEMFYSCNQLENAIFTNFEAPDLATLESMFYDCTKIKNIELDGILTNINTSKIESLKSMFYNCKELNSISLENINFLELTTMREFLFNVDKLNNVVFKNLFFSKSMNIGRLIGSNLYNLTIIFENINAPNIDSLQNRFNTLNFNNIIFKNKYSKSYNNPKFIRKRKKYFKCEYFF